ncbi:MAG: hypothetical protein VW274_04555 [Thalassolituus sp.]
MAQPDSKQFIVMALCPVHVCAFTEIIPSRYQIKPIQKYIILKENSLIQILAILESKKQADNKIRLFT